MGSRTGNGAPVIEACGVSKSFGTVTALRGVDLAVGPGRVLALLGPNGAGKTTFVRVLATLLAPDSGRATVAGFDTVGQAHDVRSLLGLTGQFTAIDPLLTGRENLEMVGELSQLGRTAARQRATDLLVEFELADVADRLSRTYSGGMQRRLDFAASMMSGPPVLVLDEPTTGLDPRSRAAVWSAVDTLVAEGATVLLTTQYLEEADRLAHAIALIDHGRIVAEGTADELKTALGGEVLEVVVRSPGDLSVAEGALTELGTIRHVDTDRRRVRLPAHAGIASLRRALDLLDAAGVEIEDIAVRRPSLDDVFLALTGSGPGGPARRDGVPAHVHPRPRSDGGHGREPGARDPRRPHAHGRVLHDTWVVVKRNFRRIGRTPRLLVVSSIQPVLYVLMFRYVFGGSLHIPGTTYIDYLVPGMFVTATLLGATTAVAMATDLSGGMVDRFRSLPMARPAVLAGRCVADLLRSLLVVVLVLVAGALIGFRFHTQPLAAVGAFGMVLAAAFSFVWLYALIGVLVKDPETAQLAGFLVVVPLIFGSSAFVRVHDMPGWLQLFARHQPVSLAVDTVRGLCQGGPVAAAAWQSGLWIVGMVTVCGWLAASLYQRR